MADPRSRRREPYPSRAGRRVRLWVAGTLLGWVAACGGDARIARDSIIDTTSQQSGGTVRLPPLEFPPTSMVTAALEQALWEQRPPDFVGTGQWPLVRRVYNDRHYEPFWVGEDGLRPEAAALLAALCDAGRHGLALADYPITDIADITAAVEQGGSGQLDAATLAQLDLLLSAAFFEYGRDLVAGRVDPATLNPAWRLETRGPAVDSLLHAALTDGAFDDALKHLAPTYPEYAGLQQGLARFREIAAAGGWETIGAGAPLRRGDRGDRVRALRARLAASGDLPAQAATAGGAWFDRALASAVARFQRRHGLVPDAVVGDSTLAELNVPVETRVGQIAANLERYRWLPGELERRYVLIDLVAGRLDAYRDGERQLTMRVRTEPGVEERGLPAVADTLSAVVFAPSWEVPPEVVRGALLPWARRDPRYLQRQGYEVLDPSGRVVDPESVDWRAVDPASFPFRLQQAPGPDGVLGGIRFVLAGDSVLQIHGLAGEPRGRRNDPTPRTGIAVERAAELAEFVLEGENGWDGDRVSASIDSTDQQVAYPAELVPMYLLSPTVFVEDGEVNFRSSGLRFDRQVIAGVNSGAAAPAPACPVLDRLASPAAPAPTTAASAQSPSGTPRAGHPPERLDGTE